MINTEDTQQKYTKMDLKVLLVVMFVLICTIESKAVSNKNKNKVKKGKKGRGRKLDSIAEINEKLGKFFIFILLILFKPYCNCYC